jgi:hypothetical protein
LGLGLTHKLINRVFRKLRVHTRQEVVRRWWICSRCSNWSVRPTRALDARNEAA